MDTTGGADIVLDGGAIRDSVVLWINEPCFPTSQHPTEQDLLCHTSHAMPQISATKVFRDCN